MCKCLKRIGLNINTIPVLDVLRVKTSSVIGTRSFSNNPNIVKILGQITVNHCHKNKIISVIKHIPGHGCAISDSHYQMPKVNLDYKELNRILKDKGEIRIYPVYFGNYHYNDEKLLNYLLNNFNITIKYPKFYKERVAYIYKGEGEEDIKKTDISVGNKEARDAESLNASVLILKKK